MGWSVGAGPNGMRSDPLIACVMMTKLCLKRVVPPTPKEPTGLPVSSHRMTEHVALPSPVTVAGKPLARKLTNV